MKVPDTDHRAQVRKGWQPWSRDWENRVGDSFLGLGRGKALAWGMEPVGTRSPHPHPHLSPQRWEDGPQPCLPPGPSPGSIC